MLQIKNRKFQPIPITIRSRDHRSIETLIIPGRGQVEIEEDLTTEVIDNLSRKGWLKVTKVA